MRIIPNIVEYIRHYTSQGYSIDKIKQFLLANNIPQKDIDNALAQIAQTTQSNHPDQSGQSRMQFNNSNSNPAVELQIKNYIQTQLHNGYNIEIIKNALLRQGFNILMINKVVNDLNNVNINVKHEVHISKGTTIGIVVALFIVGLVVFGIFNISMFKPKESLMDISVSVSPYSYLPGENVNLQIYMTNIGSMQKFDATVRYLVIDDLGNIITRKEDTIAIQTTSSNNRNIQLPQDIKPGRYILQVIASYDGKEARSSIDFEVVQKAADKKPIDYIPPTQSIKPVTPATQNTSANVIPTSTNTGKTLGEVLTEAKNTALTNPESAANDCSKLSSINQKDICYGVVADSSQSLSYCSKISGSEYRDNCYLEFVMLGNVDICDKFSDNNSKSFCEQLNIIQLMDKYSRENNTAKIMELTQQYNPSLISNNPQVQTYEYAYNEPVTILDIMSSDTSTPDEVPANESPSPSTPSPEVPAE